MTDSVSFDGVTLTKPRFTGEDYPIASSKKTLIDGKVKPYSEANVGREFTIKGYTENRADILALLGKVGISGTLIETKGLTTNAYENMRIVGPSIRVTDARGDHMAWWIELSFAQDTTGS